MAGNTFGTIFKVTTFGESHGKVIGVIIDGCPPGILLDETIIQADLDRRRPGTQVIDGQVHTSITTNRNEDDICEILSGVFEGKTTGTPIAIIIHNTDQKSADYSHIANLFRPGHADFSYQAKYGRRDYRGGGRSSGRETAARVAAGAVAKQIIAEANMRVTAFTCEAADIAVKTIDFTAIEQNALRAPDMSAAKKMEKRISELKAQGNSAGGIVECRITGVPPGLGEPVFDKLDAELAKASLSIGGIKGIEFGAGFKNAAMTGSQSNDQIHSSRKEARKRFAEDLLAEGLMQRAEVAYNRLRNVVFSPPVEFETNNAGGILGGISSGAEIIFRVAVKPVPSIALKQRTVDINGSDQDINIEGRHDACLCPRIVPVLEAMTAITMADMYLRQKTNF